RRAPSRVVTAEGGTAPGSVRLVRDWDGPRCRSRVRNAGRVAVRVGEIVLFDVSHGLPSDTGLYGEGFQMLSQTAGTPGRPADLGDYTDRKHYRMPEPGDATVVYSLLTLSPPAGGHCLLAFSSCRRFSGRFELRKGAMRVVLDAEGRELGPGEEWALEDFV